MKLRKLSFVSVTLAAVAASATPVKAEVSFYGGAALLGSKLEPRVNSSGFSVTESSSSGAKIFAGMDLTKRISVEGYFSELGSAGLSDPVIDGELDYQAAGLSGLLYLYSNSNLAERRGLMIYTRAGVGTLKNSASEGVPFARVNEGHLSAGIGAEYGFNNGMGLRAEWLNHDADAQDVSVGFIMRFPRKASELPESGMAKQADMAREEMDALTDGDAEAAPTLSPTPPPQPELQPPPPPPPPPAPETSVTTMPAVTDSDGDGVPDDVDLCAGTAQGVNVADNGCGFTGILNGVNFASGSAELTQQATDLLGGVINELQANPQLKIVVNSHTDNQGSAVNNMALSRQRAVTVVRYLADVGGIDLSRMSAVGYGESQPLQSNQTAAGRAANRRVEIAVSEQ